MFADIDGVPPDQLTDLLDRITWASWEEVEHMATAGHSAAIAALEVEDQAQVIRDAGRDPKVIDTVPFVAARLDVHPVVASVLACWVATMMPGWYAREG